MEKDSLKRWHNICLLYVSLTAWGGCLNINIGGAENIFFVLNLIKTML